MVQERRAARIFLIAHESVLLIKGNDPAHPEHGTWWMTPGGGINAGEATDAAAARELLEETGLRREPAQMGPVVARRVAEFDFDDVAYRQAESFFAVRVEEFTPSVDGWDELEQRALLEHRWWTVPDLAATDERFYPRELVDVLQALIDDRVTEPMELSGA
jgi:8-oxo-dGTP pyrophosphatase MutT (NUDIX family)